MKRPQSFLGKCLPVARADERSSLIVLKSYYDRSGQEKEAFMTLAGVASNDTWWDLIEADWRDILGRRDPPADYLHMVEASHLRGGFAKSKGWNDTKVDALLSDLMVYLAGIDKGVYCQLSATVNMSDYRKLQAESYQMDSPASLCIQGCLDRIRAWHLFKYQGLDIDSSFYFDQNEPFEPIFKARWEAEQERDRQSGGNSIWSQIMHVGSASKEKTPGIQIADLLAWGSNRQITGYEKFAHIATAMSAFIGTQWFIWDEAKLRRKYRPLT